METLAQRDHGPASPWDHAYSFCSGLYDVLDENRSLVVALISTQTFNHSAADRFPEVQATLTDFLNLLEEVLTAEAAKRGWDLDAAMVVRLIFGLVFSASITPIGCSPTATSPDARSSSRSLLDSPCRA
ncbi:MAG: hypothetical protein LC792_06250 [Actinobacteria bacterium]|nr:hypothetical protein [Actinomycetota bacterium]